jgi:predicted outer membrane protein
MRTPVARQWNRITVLTCIAGLVAAGMLLAEDPAVRRAAPTPQTAARRGENLDQLFAGCVILTNQNEINVAQLAEQRTKSPEVKKFAETLQHDHQQFLGDLEQFAGNWNFKGRQSANVSDANERRAAPQQRQAANQPGTVATAAGSCHDKLLQIRREVADECLASARRELSGKEGREFDACFIGMQLGMHMYVVDELKVLERHASPELQQTLRKGRETAQQHLDRAKEIMKDIDAGETRTTANVN